MSIELLSLSRLAITLQITPQRAKQKAALAGASPALLLDDVAYYPPGTVEKIKALDKSRRAAGKAVQS